MKVNIHFYFISFLLLTIIAIPTFTFGQENFLSVQTGHSGSINKLVFSPDGKLLASGASDNSIVVWSVQSGKQLMVFSGHKKQVNGICFHPSGEQIASCSDDKSVKIWNLKENQLVHEFTYAGEVKSIAYSPDGKILATGTNEVYLINEENQVIKTVGNASRFYHTLAFNNSGNMIAMGGKKEKVTTYSIPELTKAQQYTFNANQLIFSKDDTKLIGAGVKGNLKKWVLAKRIFSTASFTADRIWHSYNAVTVSENYFVGGNKNDLLYVYSLKNGKKIQVLNRHSKDILSVTINPTETILASAGMDQDIILWDMETWEILKILKSTVDKVNAIAFADDQHMIIGYQNGKFRYTELIPGGKTITNHYKPGIIKKYLRKEYSITRIENIKGDTVLFSGFQVKKKKKQENIITAKPFMLQWYLHNNTFECVDEGGLKIKTVDGFLFDKQNLSTTLQGSTFTISNEDITSNDFSGKITKAHTAIVTAIAVNTKGNILASSGHDGIIKLWDTESQNELLNFVACEEKEQIYVTPDNYYYSTKGALEHIGFRHGLTVLSFEQFDLLYNRPDIILEALKTEDTLLLYAYRQAHEKRVKKSGEYSTNTQHQLHDIPTVQITQGNFEATSNKKFSFEIKAQSPESALEKLHLSINGVPIHDDLNYTLSDTVSTKKISIDLSSGLNNVQYFVTNKNGNASLTHNFEVFHKVKSRKPDFYLVCLGASGYQENSYNLKYAEKDARDMELFFRNSKKFNTVNSKVFANEQVTVESITEIKNFLSNAQHDDVVFIFYAGHGLLDHNFDYFLSTYDISFKEPSKRGISYELFENILTDIKCRNKIMVIDACHSGEVDKEELTFTTVTNTEQGDLVFRGGASTVTKKNAQRSAFELSKVLFSDNKRKHGATVISSASGEEYAIEGDLWKNGIFTFCLIDGLKNKKADLNKDGAIYVSELQQYLSTKVPQLTNGKQNPTSRVENINNDFRIW